MFQVKLAFDVIVMYFHAFRTGIEPSSVLFVSVCTRYVLGSSHLFLCCYKQMAVGEYREYTDTFSISPFYTQRFWNSLKYYH